ncbi:hypothetical protein [Microbacterium sp. 18062]|uniref:hypothetical protein n=1 Tax=Microbacterium sp. 18062 TaxID=2681410 RepID=UPI00135B42DD|nr:hypothetical protein [Microbacterium sp. 18062]
MTRLDTSFFCFMHDVLDVGVEPFLDAVSGLGVSGVTVAVHYHASRDLRPRGASARVLDLPAGALYMPGDETLYPEEMAPWTPSPFDRNELLAELVRAAGSRDMRFAAWTVFGFDERLGQTHRRLCQQNAFGDAYTSDLCPANPIVADGYRGLVRDVSRSGPGAMLAESLHFQGLRLSRSLVRLDAWARLALGLCFCEHCVAAAGAAEVDAGRVAEWARETASRAWTGAAVEVDVIDRGRLGDEAGGELLRYLAVRAQSVGALYAAVADTAGDDGMSVTFLDQAAAEPPVLGPSIVDSAYAAGVDLGVLLAGALVSGSGAGYEVLGYREKPGAVERDLKAYREGLGEDARLRLALRVAPPDCESAENLLSKIRVGLDQGVEGFDFYHYGLVSDDALSRVARVIGELR